MPSRRAFICAVGGIATLAGCTGGDRSTNGELPNETAATATADDEQLVDPKRGPAETVRQFYRALLAENVDALNATIVHPESPTYPVESKHVPPAAFTEFEDVQIASVKRVSVQDRVVQQLGNPTRLRDWKEAMDADSVQHVHTTFYIKKSGEEQAYEANTVDYTVTDGEGWYVRYDATKSTHGQAGS
jgi:hypothetical protein